jgi:hypothetical protein
MPLVIEAYEATRTKSGDIVITFAPPDGFRPSGDLVSAIIDGRAVLTLEWADGSRARLPDVRDKLAARVAAAPMVSVRWMSDGLLRGAALRMV